MMVSVHAVPVILPTYLIKWVDHDAYLSLFCKKSNQIVNHFFPLFGWKQAFEDGHISRRINLLGKYH